MTTVSAHGQGELAPPPTLAALLWRVLANVWDGLGNQRDHQRMRAAKGNPGPRLPGEEPCRQPITQAAFEIDKASSSEAELLCRIYCHPIRTGFGEVVVRPISPADAPLAQAFVTGLSGTTRYLRFFQPVRNLSPAMLDRFTRTDHVAHVALAGLADVNGRPSMVAEARYVVGADGMSAEIAVAVADQWQHRGLATELMATLERVAVAAGITRLTGECLAVNGGFVALARSLGFRVYADASDRSLLRVEKSIGENCGMLPRSVAADAIRFPSFNR